VAEKNLVVAGVSIIWFKTIYQVLDIPDAKRRAFIIKHKSQNH
jgi:hypothetical protein